MIVKSAVLIFLLALSVLAFILFLKWVWTMDNQKFNRIFSIYMLGVKPHEEAFEDELAQKEQIENTSNNEEAGE